jgi:hypothetical protein
MHQSHVEPSVSRRGPFEPERENMLVPMSRGMYALTFPHRKDGRSDQHSLTY